MPINTPNLGLEKPIGSENYDIAKINANFDKIDTNALNKVTYKGEVALLINLPTTGQKVGDYYIVVEKGVPYVWNGTEFKAKITDLSIGKLFSSADSKVTPNDSDTFGYSDAADIDNPNRLKKLSWANFKAALKTYFDTFYATITNLNLKAPIANPVFTGTQTLPNIVTNGIKFPAAQVPSSDPNTFDDYEEGNFTPSVTSSGGTLTTIATNCKYIKIGKEVTIYGTITIINAGTGTDTLSVSVPFPIKDTNSAGSGYEANASAFMFSVYARVDLGLEMRKFDGGTIIGSSRALIFSVTYGTN